jgi:hypothetical protein
MCPRSLTACCSTPCFDQTRQDTDILATAPLEPLLRSIPHLEQGGIAVFSDITTRHGGSGSSELYHGGAVVLQRNATEPCCRDWCALINLPATEEVMPPSQQQPWMISWHWAMPLHCTSTVSVTAATAATIAAAATAEAAQCTFYRTDT